MLEKIDHIGVATRDLAKTIEMFKHVFQLEPHFEEEVADQKVKVAGFQIGESNIEFLEPTSEESPIAKYLEKKGEGMHHMAIKVNDVAATLEKLEQAGVRLIDETPRIGAEGKLIAFVHPKSMNGILLELSQEK